MPKVAVADIEVGMMLATDVKDRSGRTLLKAGIELTDKHIKIFKTWGVTQVEIVGKETTVSIEEVIIANPQLEQEANQLAEKIFRHVDPDHTLFSELIPVWKKRYIKDKAADA